MIHLIWGLTALTTFFVSFEGYEAADVEIQSVDVVLRESCKFLRLHVNPDLFELTGCTLDRTHR